MSHTILLIEDNEQNRYLVSFLLEQRGYKVISVTDGTSGIMKALELIPDMVLLDIQLPALDGYAVAQTIRKFDALRTLPIIAVTSYAMEGDREKCLAAGCNGYIEKPINPETFVNQIEQYLLPPDGGNTL